MNLLSELQGLSGENLCSATLRLLLIRSQELRGRFVHLLSRESRLGPITLGSHFSCTLEEPTEYSGRWGRLDLLLETSDSVVGVENKLYAAFQEDQPYKYLETVAKRAKGLGEIRGRRYQPIVAVLAPENRHSEIEEVIRENEGLLSLSWDELLSDFLKSVEEIDGETRILLNSLKSYIDQQISLFPEWTRWLPHLHRRFDSGGTELQRQVVKKVCQFFPDQRGRLSSSETWCGYYFTDRSIGERGWFGFVSKAEIAQDNEYNAEFIIAVSFDVPFNEGVFRNIHLKAGPKFIGAKQIYSWAINLDKLWAEPNYWRSSLQPLHTEYEKLKNINIQPTANKECN
jgi:hypothetical protein